MELGRERRLWHGASQAQLNVRVLFRSEAVPAEQLIQRHLNSGGEVAELCKGRAELVESHLVDDGDARLSFTPEQLSQVVQVGPVFADLSRACLSVPGAAPAKPLLSRDLSRLALR